MDTSDLIMSLVDGVTNTDEWDDRLDELTDALVELYHALSSSWPELVDAPDALVRALESAVARTSTMGVFGL